MYKKLTLATVAFNCLFVGPIWAKPRSCMPDAPNGRAPQWAVDVVKRRGGNIATSPTDPIWQHATCDESHHTVEWHLPGEGEDGK